jgi:hypothetical protein
MTPKQQKFLMETLPEFILRKQGRGFGMSTWWIHGASGYPMIVDNLRRKIPACGTVGCLGGSAEFLLGIPDDKPVSVVAAHLGLTLEEANGLFYVWKDVTRDGCGWPPRFAARYEECKTMLGKAWIAAEFCKLVGKTKGKCLHRCRVSGKN